MSDAQRIPGVPATGSSRARGGTGGGGSGGGTAGYSRTLAWTAGIVASFAVAVPLLLSPYGELAAVSVPRMFFTSHQNIYL